MRQLIRGDVLSFIDISLLNRAERRRIQSHQQLLVATAQLMTEKSYSALTIKAITDRADLGYGTFYLHFKDLDDVVWEVVYQIAEEARIETEKKISNLPFPLREYQSWVYLFEFAAQT